METELEKALKSLETAAKAAVKVLGKYNKTDLSHTPYATDPLGNIGVIVGALAQARAEASTNARFAGMSDEEIAELKATERQAELDELQLEAQARLAAVYAPVEVVAVDEEALEATGEPDGEPDGEEPNA